MGKPEGQHHEHQLGHPQSEQGGGNWESPEGQHHEHQLGQSLNRVGEGRKARNASIMTISWAILSLNRVGERLESPEGWHHQHQLGHPQSEQVGAR